MKRRGIERKRKREKEREREREGVEYREKGNIERGREGGSVCLWRA